MAQRSEGRLCHMPEFLPEFRASPKQGPEHERPANCSTSCDSQTRGRQVSRLPRF